MMNNIKKELFIIPVVVLLLSGCFGSSSSSDSSDDDGDGNGNGNGNNACATGTANTVLNVTLPQIVYTEVDETADPNDSGDTAQVIAATNTIVSGTASYQFPGAGCVDCNDFYSLTVQEGEEYSFALKSADSVAKTIFLHLYNGLPAGPDTFIALSENGSTEQRLEYTVPADVTELIILVDAQQGTGAYTLTVTTPQEPVLIETEIVPDECKANLQGSLSDATSASVTISDATISLRKGTDVKTGLADETVNVDAQGNFNFSGIAAGDYTIEVVSAGYVTVYENITLAAEKTSEKRFSLSQQLPEGQIRLVMSWGAEPQILDSHLHGPNSSSGIFTISWRNFTGDGASLDRDSTQGYGPETITISTLNTTGTYTYWINDYSNRDNDASTALAESGATVSVYTDQGLFATYKVPSGAGTRWNVLTINSEGVITPVNTLSLWGNQP